MHVSINRWGIRCLVVLSLLITFWWESFPDKWFQVPYATMVEDASGALLDAHVADDGQWRFPLRDTLSARFVTALVAFEDKRFWRHNGVDPLALARALWLNISAGRIVSGGSTLTMQVVRLSRKDQPRTIPEKIIELFWAWRLEATYSKREILQLYAAHAPFGGNVVGVEAAGWRYFGKSADYLSWAEAACLAVLPNAPAEMHPGRNRTPLTDKRNRLLKALYAGAHMSKSAYTLARQVPIPRDPVSLPHDVTPLLFTLQNWYPEIHRLQTTLDKYLQQHVNATVARHAKALQQKEVHNVAALVVEVATGKVLAYTGNTPGLGQRHGGFLDLIQAKRSSGSIIKPFLYAAAIEAGQLLPTQLIPDIPTYYQDFSPENYNKTFTGAVPARQALAQSLNVPAVRILERFGVARAKERLQSVGLTTLIYPSAHYGLSMILGGAEVKLWDLCRGYRGMAFLLRHFLRTGKYPLDPFGPLQILETPSRKSTSSTPHPGAWHASTLYAIAEAMTLVKRPAEEAAWQAFADQSKVAWKTGTSYGHRDAWAVGFDQRYVVGVWAGNADGEGRPALVGGTAAAPLLFDIFSGLPASPWFAPPVDDQVEVALCEKSGHLAGRYCPQVDTLAIPVTGAGSAVCPYHRQILLHPVTQ